MSSFWIARDSGVTRITLSLQRKPQSSSERALYPTIRSVCPRQLFPGKRHLLPSFIVVKRARIMKLGRPFGDWEIKLLRRLRDYGQFGNSCGGIVPVDLQSILLRVRLRNSKNRSKEPANLFQSVDVPGESFRCRLIGPTEKTFWARSGAIEMKYVPNVYVGHTQSHWQVREKRYAVSITSAPIPASLRQAIGGYVTISHPPKAKTGQSSIGILLRDQGFRGKSPKSPVPSSNPISLPARHIHNSPARRRPPAPSFRTHLLVISPRRLPIHSGLLMVDLQRPWLQRQRP
jgi:hypothetical protein